MLLLRRVLPASLIIHARNQLSIAASYIQLLTAYSAPKSKSWFIVKFKCSHHLQFKFMTTKHQCPINISYQIHGQDCHAVAMHLHALTCRDQASPKASLKPAQGLFQVPGITSAGTYILPLKTIYKYDIFKTESDNKSPLSHSRLLSSLLALHSNR